MSIVGTQWTNRKRDTGWGTNKGVVIAVAGRVDRLMNRSAVFYGIRLLVQRLLGLFLFLVGSGFAADYHSWVYFGTGLAIALLGWAYMYRINPDVLAQRGKVVTDSPVWDKWLLGLYWLLHFFVIHLVAGLEFGERPLMENAFWAGMAFVWASSGLALAALRVNPFLESTARLQAERGQFVVQAGVYGVVRHPTYAAVLLSCFGVCLVFPTKWVLVLAILIAALIVVRTSLEDRMLMEKLPGYSTYAQKVRYRLIPFVW